MRTPTSRYLEFFELEQNRGTSPTDEPHRVEGPGQFVLGYAEERVTLFSQQVRALNLAYSLNCLGRLYRGTRLLIVGAGPAGITLGAAAQLLGAEVEFLEKAPVAMAVFAPKDVGGRFIQPLAAEWPAARSLKDNAGLPVCSWRSGNGKEIAEAIRSGFHSALGTAARLNPSSVRPKLFYDAENLRIERRQGPSNRDWYCSWNSRSESGDLNLSFDPTVAETTRDSFHKYFDLVIFAFGPGPERHWMNDSGTNMVVPYFSAPSDTSGVDKPLVVSGAGDGGLIDVLLHQTGKSHHDFMQTISDRHSSFATLREELLLIERAAASSLRRTIDIMYAYSELRTRQATVVDAFYSDVFGAHRGRQTTLFSKEGQWLSPRVQPLHRFCCWLLKEHGRLTALAGEVPRQEIRDGVFWSFRHGPAHSDKLAVDILKTLRNQMHRRSALDFTRDPIWPDGFFPVIHEDGLKASVLPAHGGLPPIEPPADAHQLAPSHSTTTFESISADAKFELLENDCRGWIQCEGTDRIIISSLPLSGKFSLDHEALAVDGARLEVRSGSFEPSVNNPPQNGNNDDKWLFEVEQGKAHAIPETSIAYSVTGPPGSPYAAAEMGRSTLRSALVPGRIRIPDLSGHDD